MFKRVLFLLLILTILISVPVYAEDNQAYTLEEENFISYPVYPEDDEAYTLEEDPNFIDFITYAEGVDVYTLEPGKVYRFRSSNTVGVEFSDYVLCSFVGAGTAYKRISHYNYTDYINGSIEPYYSAYINVYNTNNGSVTMILNEGTISEFAVFDSPFSLVMYDCTETDFQIINNTGAYQSFKQFEYNELDHSFDASGEFLTIGGSHTLTGMGFLLVDFPIIFDFDGVYEIGDYVRSDFFPVPPWILRMDLTGTIRVLLDQLSMLLPVALVILSVFLLISLAIYTIRLFL